MINIKQNQLKQGQNPQKPNWNAVGNIEDSNDKEKM